MPTSTRTRASAPTPAFIPPCKRTGCFSEGAGINRGGIPDRGWRPPARGGLTPLLYAARDGRVAEAEQLLAAGADVELAEANGIRPLLMALLNNQLPVVDLLLKHGADVNADDFWGRSPLFAAVEYRNRDLRNRDLIDAPVDRAALLDVIALLIERGANVNARTREWPHNRTSFTSDLSWVDVTGQTPFLRAALAGDTTVMRLLLAHGADPNIATFEGTTPLMAAAGVNWTVAQTYTESPQALLDAIQICLDHGADVNAVNSMGVTAMIGAANRGSNDIIRFLHSKGARLDVVDKQGRSPLRWAEGVFLATTGAEIKPETIALLQELAGESAGRVSVCRASPYSVSASAVSRRWPLAAYVYQQHRTPSVNVAEQWAMLDRYCEDCHNDAERAGDLAFDRLDPSRMHADAAVWETVIRKLRGGLMPPPGEPRPAAERLDAFVGFLEESLDAAARTAPNPGTPGLRRLNRTEYANARAGPHRVARRRGGIAARRRFGRRLRQHRQRAQHLAHACCRRT